MNELPQRLRGCEVLPPLIRDDVEPQRSTVSNNQGDRVERTKPKGPSQQCKAAADRFAVLNNFIDFTLRDLRRNEAAVWLVLYRDSRDGIARTAQSDIARRSGVSDRTVRRILLKLAQLGLLKMTNRGGINRGPSSYRVFPLMNASTADKALSVLTGQNHANTADTVLSYIP